MSKDFAKMMNQEEMMKELNDFLENYSKYITIESSKGDYQRIVKRQFDKDETINSIYHNFVMNGGQIIIYVDIYKNDNENENSCRIKVGSAQLCYRETKFGYFRYFDNDD